MALVGPWVATDEAVTSILVYGEVVERIRPQATYAPDLKALHRLIRGVQPIGLNRSVLRRYADIRLQLRPVGQLIGDVDTLIAAIALEHGLTVVTVDGDFARVPGLSVLRVTKQQLT
jgi:predicted nucleic acid-binding protein